MTREVLAQLWRERLDEYSESGKSVQEWCGFNGIPIYQYYYWRRRLASLNTRSADTGSWLAAEVVDSSSAPFASGGVTIRIAGAAIELTPGFDPDLLRAVVRALAEDPC